MVVSPNLFVLCEMDNLFQPIIDIFISVDILFNWIIATSEINFDAKPHPLTVRSFI